MDAMGLGFSEIVVIAIAALVFLGPTRLPEVMKTVARLYVQLRRTSNEFKSSFDQVVREAEAEVHAEEIAKLRARMAEEARKLIDMQPTPPALPGTAPIDFQQNRSLGTSAFDDNPAVVEKPENTDKPSV
jgi:Tat protein translocase TatB subunit